MIHTPVTNNAMDGDESKETTPTTDDGEDDQQYVGIDLFGDDVNSDVCDYDWDFDEVTLDDHNKPPPWPTANLVDRCLALKGWERILQSIDARTYLTSYDRFVKNIYARVALRTSVGVLGT